MTGFKALENANEWLAGPGKYLYDIRAMDECVKTLKAILKRYFLTGLLVITPIWGTILILKTLFLSVDSILGNMLAQVVQPGYYVPGLGVVTLLLLIVTTGLLAANFIGGQIVPL